MQNIIPVKLTNTVYHQTNFGNTVYHQTNFGNTVCHQTNFGNTVCHQTNFGNTVCHQTNFGNTVCHQTNFGNTVCHQTNFGNTVCHQTVSYGMLWVILLKQYFVWRSLIPSNVIFQLRDAQFGPLWSIWANISEKLNATTMFVWNIYIYI